MYFKIFKLQLLTSKMFSTLWFYIIFKIIKITETERFYIGPLNDIFRFLKINLAKAQNYQKHCDKDILQLYSRNKIKNTALLNE